MLGLLSVRGAESIGVNPNAANVSCWTLLFIRGCCLKTTYPNLGPVRSGRGGGPKDPKLLKNAQFCIKTHICKFFF